MKFYICAIVSFFISKMMVLSAEEVNKSSGMIDGLTLSSFIIIAPTASLLGLAFAFYFFKQMIRADEGTDQMREIAEHIRDGAKAYLSSQFRIVIIVMMILFVILSVMAFFNLQNRLVPFTFLSGAIFSGLCGYLGMQTATLASSRTAQGARESLNRGLQIAFRSGAVMGLVVVGFGLFNIWAWFVFLDKIVYSNAHMISGWSIFVQPGFDPAFKLSEITTAMLGYGIGASLQALFARVGGGIFTKAADVGADLVGKVEAGIPEDDPRNPATIADNVGDNVGDVAGMGADLYESYCGSIIATAALGAALPITAKVSGLDAVVAPMVVAGIGIILSILGIFLVKCKEDASMTTLLKALDRGTWISTLLVVAVLAVFAKFDFISWGVFGSVVSGLISGIITGWFTGYYTSDEYEPTKGIAGQAVTGSATTIIDGIAVGMMSSCIPVITIVTGILCAYGFSGGFTDPDSGLYGIGFAAVGMLSTLGITLATDAYGPIADNAGGNAEMSGLPAEVRERTDALDMLGNTTAAVGKGFAIGSAALTALALLATYVLSVKTWSLKLGLPLVQIKDMSLMNPMVLCGIFVGGMMAFLFCALTMKAVGRAAGAMVTEVRRQFKTIRGIMTYDAKPDYAKCVAIATNAAQKEMMIPSLLAVFVPIITGLILGVPGVLGMLAGGLATGFSLACMLNNAGGAWDNAKKYVEKGNLGGKGSDVHKACVVGDTVGDPFKDTAGPSLNILLKLMSMVSVIFTPVIVKFSPIIQKILHISN